MWNYNFYVYLLTNQHHTVLYTGVTNNLSRRLYEHKHKLVPGFTQKYNVNKLIYFEHFTQIEEAIAREKQIKGWKREKKVQLIESLNPDWKEWGEGE
jgi:putative endonuclease